MKTRSWKRLLKRYHDEYKAITWPVRVKLSRDGWASDRLTESALALYGDLPFETEVAERGRIIFRPVYSRRNDLHFLNQRLDFSRDVKHPIVNMIRKSIFAMDKIKYAVCNTSLRWLITHDDDDTLPEKDYVNRFITENKFQTTDAASVYLTHAVDSVDIILCIDLLDVHDGCEIITSADNLFVCVPVVIPPASRDKPLDFVNMFYYTIHENFVSAITNVERRLLLETNLPDRKEINQKIKVLDEREL